MNYKYFLLFQELKGPHFFAFGDHGGLIVAVKQNEMTNEVL